MKIFWFIEKNFQYHTFLFQIQLSKKINKVIHLFKCFYVRIISNSKWNYWYFILFTFKKIFMKTLKIFCLFVQNLFLSWIKQWEEKLCFLLCYTQYKRRFFLEFFKIKTFLETFECQIREQMLIFLKEMSFFHRKKMEMKKN